VISTLACGQSTPLSELASKRDKRTSNRTPIARVCLRRARALRSRLLARRRSPSQAIARVPSLCSRGRPSLCSARFHSCAIATVGLL
jgi:hypothetical protein